MGKNAKIRARRNRFKKGDLIQLVKPVGFLPAGLYCYEGLRGRLVHLSAGDILVGIYREFLNDCYPLASGEKTPLKTPTEADFIAHHKDLLELYRAECPVCDGPLEITKLTLTNENASELGIPPRMHAKLPCRSMH